MKNSNSNQIVYVLVNPAMPGLIKIGKTTQLEVKERMKQLYSTGVPVPFECVYACRVKDAGDVEKRLHFAFGDSRINPNREFFKIDAERVVAILQMLQIDEITEQVEHTLESDVTAADKQSAQKLKEARRKRMNFHELGIPSGSVLVSKDGSMQVTVVDERTVDMNGAQCSLTEATRKLLGLPDNYSIQPSPYWTFNGKTVREIYDEYHSKNEEA